MFVSVSGGVVFFINKGRKIRYAFVYYPPPFFNWILTSTALFLQLKSLAYIVRLDVLGPLKLLYGRK